MEFPNPYWSPKTKIELLQRWILVHSYIYYSLDDNVVSDHMFDKNSKQLVSLQLAHPDHFIRSRYYYVMKDFDGSSGFGLTDGLAPEHFDVVRRDAMMLLILNRRK